MHTCPECGSACYCRGDIDDINLGDPTYCEHYLHASCSYNDRDDEEDYERQDAEARETRSEDDAEYENRYLDRENADQINRENRRQR